MNGTIDLRSDTVTQPTEAMREAMSRAEVGDDDYNEDPTINRLQELAAARLGKADALFLPSGTMANLVALLCHTHPGDEVIVDHQAHIYLDEIGGISAVAGVLPRPVVGNQGAITPALVEAILRPPDQPHAPTRLLCLENTHNLAGGTVMSPLQMANVSATAHNRGLRVHLDGARIFNAAIALGTDARLLAHDADSVMFCLSKGLSAPVGSLLLGEATFVTRARLMRKMLGGGMRQAGVLAAAGIVALEMMVDRLSEDHLHAKLLAERLARLPGLVIDLASVQTNIIMVNVPDARLVVQRLAARNVLANTEGPARIRLVTHRHIGPEDIDEAVDAFHQIMNPAGES